MPYEGIRKNADASATYKKLNSGEWGCWTDLPDLKPGQRITVTAKNGHTRLERLARLIHQGDGYSLWSLQK